MGVNLEGHKERLGLWLSENEGAKFWLGILTELQNRGLKDILIACVDGLKGFSDAYTSGLSTDPYSAVYCAHGAPQHEVSLLERL